MGLLDSPYVGQLVKTGTIERTFSSDSLISDTIKLDGRNVIKFKITVVSGTLSEDGNVIRLKGGILSTGYIDIYCRQRERAISANDDGYLGTPKSKLVAGDWVSMDISLYEYIEFYGYTTEAVSVKIEYVIAYEDVLTKTANSILTAISSKVDSVISSLVKPIDILIHQETIDVSSDTGNYYFSANLKTLLNVYKGLRMDVEFSAADANIRMNISRILGTNSLTPRTASYFVTEDGYMLRSIDAPTNNDTNKSYYITELASKYCFRCDRKASASGITCTFKVYATTAVPEIRHTQLLYSLTNTLVTDAASTTNITLDEYIRRFKFFFVTVEGTSLSGDILTVSTIIDDSADGVLAEFDNVNNYATKWLPVTFDNIVVRSRLKGDGAMTMSVWGVI